jgi:hypothetical protein
VAADSAILPSSLCLANCHLLLCNLAGKDAG